MKMSKKIEVWRQNGHAGYTEADTTMSQAPNGKAEEKNDSNTSADSDNSNKEMGKYYDNFYELMNLRSQVYSKLGWWPESLFLPVEITNQQTDLPTHQQLRRPVLMENTNMNCMPNQGQGTDAPSGNNQHPRARGSNPTGMPSQGVSPNNSYTRDMPPHIRELVKRDPFL